MSKLIFQLRNDGEIFIDLTETSSPITMIPPPLPTLKQKVLTPLFIEIPKPRRKEKREKQKKLEAEKS